MDLATAQQLVSSILGKKISYKKENGESRLFTVVSVENFDLAKSTGKWYLRGKLIDHNDNNEEKERTLHLEGIS